MTQLKDIIHFYLDAKAKVKRKADSEYHIGRICEVTKISNHGDWIKVVFDNVITVSGRIYETASSNAHTYFINEDNIQLVLRRLSDMTEEEARHIARLAFFTQDMNYPDRDYSVYKTESVTTNKTPTAWTVRLSNDWWEKKINIGIKTGTIWYPDPATGERVWNYQLIFVYLHKQQFDLYGLIDTNQAIDAKTI